MTLDRRLFLASSTLLAATPAMAARSGHRPPNLILIFCDDLGYGDIGPMGGKSIATPHLDAMAASGTVFTDFYSAANICTPSRAGLLTGRYPIRTGLGHQVIMPNDDRGLPHSEVTIARALKPAGYTSGLFGKWHLGHKKVAWPPTRHGFDRFFGLPYSHDMNPLSLYDVEGDGPLREEEVDFPQLQQRFYAEAERFIIQNAKRPFFVELALSAPHLPTYPVAPHAGKSAVGAYGDTVEEIDAIVGRLRAKLKELRLEEDTLIVFTSDNGPWFEGSAGPLRQRKGGAGYDGGYRVPMIISQPGTVPAGVRSSAIGMSIDFLPTFCALAGTRLPSGVTIDGRDLSSLFHGKTALSPHEELILFDNENPVAIRTQRWKYVAADYYRGWLAPIEGKYPQLYDVSVDPSENYNLADRYPEITNRLKVRLAEVRKEFEPLRTQPLPASPFAAPSPATRSQ